MRRRAERTHQLQDDGTWDARATEVSRFRRDFLKQTGLRTFQNDVSAQKQHPSEARASSDTPRREVETTPMPLSARSARTPKANRADMSGNIFKYVLEEKDQLDTFAATPFPHTVGAAPASTTRTDTPSQLKSQSSNLSTGSEPGKVEEGGQGAHVPEFDPILEMSSMGDGTSRAESVRHRTTTVNSLASSRAADFNLETSESLGFQHQLAWLYFSGSGTKDQDLENMNDGSKHHSHTVNSLGSSDALNVGDPGRFRRTDTLQLSNERRLREAEEALLSELKKEHQSKHSNTIESLLASWPESLQLTPPEGGASADSNSTSRQVSLSPDPQCSNYGQSSNPATESDVRPSSRGSTQGLTAPRPRSKKPSSSMASLENIQEELDDDPSIAFSAKRSEKSIKSVKSQKSDEAEKNGERRPQNGEKSQKKDEKGRSESRPSGRPHLETASLSPRVYQNDPKQISSFE